MKRSEYDDVNDVDSVAVAHDAPWCWWWCSGLGIRWCCWSSIFGVWFADICWLCLLLEAARPRLPMPATRYGFSFDVTITSYGTVLLKMSFSPHLFHIVLPPWISWVKRNINHFFFSEIKVVLTGRIESSWLGKSIPAPALNVPLSDQTPNCVVQVLTYKWVIPWYSICKHPSGTFRTCPCTVINLIRCDCNFAFNDHCH